MIYEVRDLKKIFLVLFLVSIFQFNFYLKAKKKYKNKTGDFEVIRPNILWQCLWTSGEMGIVKLFSRGIFISPLHRPCLVGRKLSGNANKSQYFSCLLFTRASWEIGK